MSVQHIPLYPLPRHPAPAGALVMSLQVVTASYDCTTFPSQAPSTWRGLFGSTHIHWKNSPPGFPVPPTRVSFLPLSTILVHVPPPSSERYAQAGRVQEAQYSKSGLPEATASVRNCV